MLAELRVEDLGVIARLEVVLGPGLTVVTGETGAGKTLVVEALELLLGGRGDVSMVRAGADEAVVEGRFLVPPATTGAARPDGTRELDEAEVVVRRVLPAAGRSRSYLDGAMAPVAALEARGRTLVDLHGQHAHQSLLRPASQRAALDRFAGVDLGPLVALRRQLAAVDARLGELGGDERQRRRELDLVRFELDEIAQARLTGPDEQEQLAEQEEALAHATARREAVAGALAALGGAAPSGGYLAGGGDDGGAVGQLGTAIAVLDRAGLTGHAERLRSLQGELEDAVHALRLDGEAIEEDPAALETVRARRHLLRGLVRKHGTSLADVLAAAEAHAGRLDALEHEDEARSGLERERRDLLAAIAGEEATVGDARRAAAGALAAAVETHLRELAMPAARLAVALPTEGLADDVELLLGANPGEPLLPLARIASGGELARSMLALRLVLTAGPPTLVFDEVDAGIGGAAAVAVGRALAALAADHQVLVVTHLPQVAARADRHLVVEKTTRHERTVTELRPVEGPARLAELSRMLAGNAGSAAGRRHAEELLAEALLAEGPGDPPVAGRPRSSGR